MSESFAARMREAKLVKMDARNRGQAQGSYRGTVRVRTAADLDRGMDALELDIAALVQATFADPIHAFGADLDAAVLDLNDDTATEIPF